MRACSWSSPSAEALRPVPLPARGPVMRVVMRVVTGRADGSRATRSVPITGAERGEGRIAAQGQLEDALELALIGGGPGQSAGDGFHQVGVGLRRRGHGALGTVARTCTRPSMPTTRALP